MIDGDGYRPNVGIVVANGLGQVLWARRTGEQAWQFPQGGIRSKESPEEAMYRELEEEIGLQPDHVRVLGVTQGWLEYKSPRRLHRRHNAHFIGQKQRWFMLQMLAKDDRVALGHAAIPEFDRWRWVSYWYPLGQIVSFKKEVYRRALKELAPNLSKCLAPVGHNA